MAIATYTLSSGSTWKGTAITDATDFSLSESSSPTRISTDGSKSVGLIVVDQKVATISVNGVNKILLATAAFRAGTTGALVCKVKLRGAGETVSTEKTFTFAEAVLVSTSAAAPNEGNGTITLNFEAYDSDDNVSLFAIT